MRIHNLVPTTYPEAARLLGGRSKRRLSANTSLVRRSPDSIALRLHQTDVVTYRADGLLVLATGGWRTAVTKARINAALRRSGRRLAERKGEWLLYSAATGEEPEFFEGVAVPAVRPRPEWEPTDPEEAALFLVGTLARA